MALSYEFSIGSVRAKEKNLFTNSDIEHMLGCENVNELCRYLSDKGYGEGDDIEDILKSHSENVCEYLKSVLSLKKRLNRRLRTESFHFWAKNFPHLVTRHMKFLHTQVTQDSAMRFLTELLWGLF